MCEIHRNSCSVALKYDDSKGGVSLNSSANKTELFRKAINADADERCAKIRSDVDAYVDAELKATRRAARLSVRHVRSSEFDRLNEEINSELSETETKETEKLVAKRNEITQKVFAKAKEQIISFTKSEDYRAFIMKSASQIKSAIGDDSVIILRPDDKALEGEIKALGCDVGYDGTIILGGCKGKNLRTGMTADDTLDSRLEAEKQSFCGYSGLSLSL